MWDPVQKGFWSCPDPVMKPFPDGILKHVAPCAHKRSIEMQRCLEGLPCGHDVFPNTIPHAPAFAWLTYVRKTFQI